MKKWVIAGAVTIAGVVAGSSLIAGELGRLDPAFRALDTNRDGDLSVEEALVDKSLATHFTNVDRNDNSRISLREFLATK